MAQDTQVSSVLKGAGTHTTDRQISSCEVGNFGVISGHHASEGLKIKLVGGDLLEQLLMTTTPTAK